MSQLVQRWITILIVLILVYLIVKNGAQFGKIVNAATNAQVGTIVRLQGREAGQYIQ